MPENTRTFRVEWGETDAAGIVFYPNFYRWFDQATHELFRAIGYPVAAMIADGVAVPLVEAQAQFRSPLRYDEEVTLVSRFAETRTRTFRVEHVIARAGAPVCEGHEERVWVRIREGEIVAEAIPDNIRALMIGE